MITHSIPMEYWISQKGFRILFLLIVCYFTFFIHNEVIFADIMESRNLVTAREIISDGNWLIPRMNGELRIEKPPLPTWIAAVVEYVFPDSLAAQRTVAGLMATLLIFFFYGFAAMLCRSKVYGLISAVILCTSFNIILMGRTATWDIYCHGFMMGAIYFIFRGGQKKGKAWTEFLIAGFLLGCSFLGKGPVSFYALLLPFIIAYTCFFPRRASFRRKTWPLVTMLLICLVISLWWPVLLYIEHREMAMSVWNKESTAWLERSVRPWYYYWKFFLESGIWSLFLITSLVWPYWKERIYRRREYLFSVCWVFMVLICLSVLPEKKTRYLLPILIPSALTVAYLFVYWLRKAKDHLPPADRIIFRINSLLIAIIVGCLPVGICLFFYIPGKLSSVVFILLTLVFSGIAVWLFRTALHNKVWKYLTGILLLFFVIEAFMLPYVVGFFNNPDFNSIHAVREIRELDGLPFYHDQQEEMRIEIVYEAGRKILPYDFVNGNELPELPFVLVSEGKAEDILPSGWLEKVDLKLIGIYDDNKRPANTSWHSPKFVHRVTKVTASERE